MFQINGVQSPSDYVKVAVVTDQQVSFLLELDYQTFFFFFFAGVLEAKISILDS
jgi:hypothetical protein